MDAVKPKKYRRLDFFCKDAYNSTKKVDEIEYCIGLTQR